MSKYAEIKTQIKDPEILIQTLKDMGFDQLRNHLGDPQQLQGFQGDLRKDRAEIIIPRRQVGSASNDLGFTRDEDGAFRMIVSSYDSSRYGVDSKWYRQLGVNYQDRWIKTTAKKQGLRAIHTGKKLDNGNLEYKFLKAGA